MKNTNSQTQQTSSEGDEDLSPEELRILQEFARQQLQTDIDIFDIEPF